jgi:hypothetical protein
VGLRDVTGVFSRFFVVGFFVPSFFVVLALAALFVELDRGDVAYVVGGVALPLALSLVGVRDALWKAAERWPCRRGRETTKERCSPFGRATDEYHRRVKRRWRLDVYQAWPFIKPFFNDYERELDIDGRSDVHFFLNSCLGGVAIAVGLVVDAFDSPVQDEPVVSLGLGLAALLAAGLAYRGAMSAVKVWGEFKEAAVVVHRFELYEHLGLTRPESPDQERRVVEQVNEMLRRDDDAATEPSAPA